jgi:hypothetical protein
MRLQELVDIDVSSPTSPAGGETVFLILERIWFVGWAETPT